MAAPRSTRPRKHGGVNGTGIGVLGGPASGDLIGIDIDTEDSQIVAALLTVLPPTEVKKAGARGETWFYHGPGIASRKWSINGKRIVEIIGAGPADGAAADRASGRACHTVGSGP